MNIINQPIQEAPAAAPAAVAPSPVEPAELVSSGDETADALALIAKIEAEEPPDGEPSLQVTPPVEPKPEELAPKPVETSQDKSQLQRIDALAREEMRVRESRRQLEVRQRELEATASKQAELQALLELRHTDPVAFLEALDLDAEKLAQHVLKGSKPDPVNAEVRKLREEMEKDRAEHKRQQEAIHNERLQRAVAREKEDMTGAIRASADKHPFAAAALDLEWLGILDDMFDERAKYFAAHKKNLDVGRLTAEVNDRLKSLYVHLHGVATASGGAVSPAAPAPPANPGMPNGIPAMGNQARTLSASSHTSQTARSVDDMSDDELVQAAIALAERIPG